jgi:Family of unknown function (DUF6074)
MLLAFPLRHRHAFVRRLAAQVLTRSAEQGEKHLALQLRKQAMSMARKSFSDEVVRREIASLEAAVRGEMWRQMLGAPSLPPTVRTDSETTKHDDLVG